LSKVDLRGGRSRESDESARLVLHAPPSAECFTEIRAARPKHSLFPDRGRTGLRLGVDMVAVDSHNIALRCRKQ